MRFELYCTPYSSFSEQYMEWLCRRLWNSSRSSAENIVINSLLNDYQSLFRDSNDLLHEKHLNYTAENHSWPTLLNIQTILWLIDKFTYGMMRWSIIYSVKLETHTTKSIPNPIWYHFETFHERWTASYLQIELYRDNLFSCTEFYRGKKNSSTQFSDKL